MKYYQVIEHAVNKLPKQVRLFLMRVIVLFIGWKMLYLFILIPAEVPDAWLVKQLGKGTVQALNFFYDTTDFTAQATTKKKIYGTELVNVTFSHVQWGKKKLIGIYQACNGLELLILYAGFILAFSGSWQTKMLFIAGGISILFLINILRLVMLGIISIEYPAHFQFAHKYLFNMIVYAITFLLWMGYVKVKHRKEINHSMNNHD